MKDPRFDPSLDIAIANCYIAELNKLLAVLAFGVVTPQVCALQ
jgi:hypothetical protein